MYQATGEAPGTTGFVHITDAKGGKVRFTPEDNPSQTDVVFVKSVLEMPYNISVIQISQVIKTGLRYRQKIKYKYDLTFIVQNVRITCKSKKTRSHFLIILLVR
ncbi:putative fasciclin-like arabinogalactan protein [Helianthus annuus]|nr:putative fasciclin-like arabinogalactan protein [Helianthus annuus]